MAVCHGGLLLDLRFTILTSNPRIRLIIRRITTRFQSTNCRILQVQHEKACEDRTLHSSRWIDCSSTVHEILANWNSSGLHDTCTEAALIERFTRREMNAGRQS
eukprot:754724-Hanusia_phi.AAC.1